MTSATAATVEEGDGGPWATPVPRVERRRRRRERRVVIATSALVLSLLVGTVTAVLGHLRQGRTTQPRGMNHSVACQVDVTKRAA